MKRSLLALGLCLSFGSAYAQRAPERTFNLIDVNWKLSFDETSGQIFGDVTNTVRPLRPNVTKVAFQAVKLEISKVYVDGASSSYLYDGKEVQVPLPVNVSTSQALKVRIVYSGTPSAGVYFIPKKRAFPAKSSMVYTQGEMIDTRYWLPTYDWPDDKATSEATITVPKGYYALSNGRLLERMVSGENETFHWKLDQPVSTYLISFVAGKYDEGTDPGAAIPTYYYVPAGLKSWGDVSFGGTSKIVDFYGKLTGFTYPYAKFSQAAVSDFMFGGMENTTAVTQTINAIYPPEVADYESATGLIAHELAHQWFGDTATATDWEHIWLNEGFATFLPTFGPGNHRARKITTLSAPVPWHPHGAQAARAGERWSAPSGKSPLTCSMGSCTQGVQPGCSCLWTPLGRPRSGGAFRHTWRNISSRMRPRTISLRLCLRFLEEI